MASHHLKPIAPFLLLMALMATTQLAVCQSLKAKISCLDCEPNYDLSGNKIVVKCEKVKELSEATTEADGSFETVLPSPYSSDTSNCIAELLGGPQQLYASRKDMASRVVKLHNSNFFTISTPLKFSTSPTSSAMKQFVDDSKTINLPLPPEWGLAPSSYYLPVLPIIGIP